MTFVIDALGADRSVALGICTGLTEADWAAPSGCAGWSVQDLISHLATTYWLVVDRSQLPDAGDRPAEAANDFYVESRRDLSPAAVLADYEQASAKALDILATFDGQAAELPLGDLGTYPLSVLPTAFAFEHYLHLRADLFAPRGPLPAPPPPADEARLSSALDWIQAALPQQNAAALATLDGAIELVLEGPAARVIRSGPGTVLATVTCAAPDFPSAITQRVTWESAGARLVGTPAALAVVRQLKIF